MRISKVQKAGLAGAAIAGLVFAGLGTAYGASADSPVPASASGDGPRPAEENQGNSAAVEGEFESSLKLSDGRTVHVRLVEGTGVQERHKAAGSRKWSKWQTLYKSESDRCQGVGLAEADGTVSLIADFGRYCYDGEPPTESVAGVGTGDLTDWDIDMTEDFDGWQDTSITDEGSKVLFVYNSDAGLYTLRWNDSEGFSEIDGPDEK